MLTYFMQLLAKEVGAVPCFFYAWPCAFFFLGFLNFTITDSVTDIHTVSAQNVAYFNLIASVGKERAQFVEFVRNTSSVDVLKVWESEDKFEEDYIKESNCGALSAIVIEEWEPPKYKIRLPYDPFTANPTEEISYEQVMFDAAGIWGTWPKTLGDQFEGRSVEFRMNAPDPVVRTFSTAFADFGSQWVEKSLRESIHQLRDNERILALVRSRTEQIHLHWIMIRPDGSVMDPAVCGSFKNLEAMAGVWVPVFEIHLKLTAIPPRRFTSTGSILRRSAASNSLSDMEGSGSGPGSADSSTHGGRLGLGMKKTKGSSSASLKDLLIESETPFVQDQYVDPDFDPKTWDGSLHLGGEAGPSSEINDPQPASWPQMQLSGRTRSFDFTSSSHGGSVFPGLAPFGLRHSKSMANLAAAGGNLDTDDIDSQIPPATASLPSFASQVSELPILGRGRGSPSLSQVHSPLSPPQMQGGSTSTGSLTSASGWDPTLRAGSPAVSPPLQPIPGRSRIRNSPLAGPVAPMAPPPPMPPLPAGLRSPSNLLLNQPRLLGIPEFGEQSSPSRHAREGGIAPSDSPVREAGKAKRGGTKDTEKVAALAPPKLRRKSSSEGSSSSEPALMDEK